MENLMLGAGVLVSLFQLSIIGSGIAFFVSLGALIGHWPESGKKIDRDLITVILISFLGTISLICVDIFWHSTVWPEFAIHMLIILGLLVFVGFGSALITDRKKWMVYPVSISLVISLTLGVAASYDGDKILAEAFKPDEQGPIEDLVLKRFTDFSTSEGHHIATLIKDMQQSEISLLTKIGDLSKTLEAFGHNVNDDPEYISWNRKLASLKTDRAQLKGKLEEAFIWSEKFRLSPSTEHKAELSARITECNTLATELAGRYRELIELKSTG